jgi:hypothetical protein
MVFYAAIASQNTYTPKKTDGCPTISLFPIPFDSENLDVWRSKRYFHLKLKLPKPKT